jgi:putative transposase
VKTSPFTVNEQYYGNVASEKLMPPTQDTWDIIAAAVEDDHVHLLVEYPPKVAVSSLVNSLKGVSSRLLRKERPDIQKSYWKGVLWSPSYFASSCGGAPISMVRQYIEQQQTPH